MIVKTEEEKEILREGGRRLATLLHELGEKTLPGVSAADLDAHARARIEAWGDTPAFLNYKPVGANRPFPAAICVSINEDIVHGIPNEDEMIIQNGDVVGLDCGLVHEGLVVDATITVIAGTADKEDERLVAATKEALAAAVKAARVGNTTRDIGRAVQGVGEKYGFESPKELGGHGVGSAVHEEPFVPNWDMPSAREVLQEGQVLAIEPMFAHGSAEITLADDGYTYFTTDGSNTAEFEHTVIVGKDEAEIVTRV